jgi:hypothetical protein
MNDYRISLLALMEAHSVLREIHEIIGPDPRAVIPSHLYVRLVSAEGSLGSCVHRIGRKVDLDIVEA